MQEQVNEKSVSLIIKGTRLTGRMLEKALRKLLIEMKMQKQKAQIPKTYQGRQSVKQLVRQGAGVSNIAITDSNIKSFERVARKYGVDFALKKDVSTVPPKWLVFFKARDADALTAAFSEYTAKTVKKTGPEKPSLLSDLRKNIEFVKNQVVDKVKHKNRGERQL